MQSFTTHARESYARFLDEAVSAHKELKQLTHAEDHILHHGHDGLKHAV